METGIFKKHLGKDKEVEIEGTVYKLRPLQIDDASLFFKALKTFKRLMRENKGISIEETLDSIDDEGMIHVSEMVKTVLKRSYPEEPEEERDCFAMKYLFVLMPAIFEMTLPTVDPSIKEKLLKDDTKPQV